MNNDSSKKFGKRFIKAGRKTLRTKLYMATVASIKFNPTTKKKYQQLKEAGKHSKVAITACMRHLLITINSMLAKNKYG
jgi:transposase